MDESYRFSVIIPVYNSARTIGRCLDSILAQHREDVQLVLINDGSGDESGAICREYAEKFPCICFISKENGGVSSARNLGLDHAKGKYVLFVDSDDYVADNYFETIDRALAAGSPDLLLFGNYSVSTGEQPTNRLSFCSENDAESSEIVAGLMINNGFNALWIKCFSNEIIQANHLRFDQTIEIAEDLQFIFSYVMHVHSVKAIPDALYCVDESNQNSLSRKTRPNLGEQLMHSALSMKAILESSNLASPAKKQYAQAVSRMYYRSVYSAAKELNRDTAPQRERIKRIRQICSEFSRQRVPALGLKNKLIAAPVRLNMVHLIDGMARGRLR